jgi:hypothetical protein
MGFFRNALLVAQARWRFRRGPIGQWHSRAGGGGFDNVHGYALKFDPDGTGILWEWGQPEEPAAGTLPFAWRCTGRFCIEIRLEQQAEWEVVKYRVSWVETEYERYEICLEQIGQTGFWVSPYPMAYYAAAG